MNLSAHPKAPGTSLASGPAIVPSIPDDDIEEWRNLPEKERARVRLLLRCFAELHTADNLHAAAQRLALRHHHLGWGWSAKSLLRLYWAWRDGGHKPGDFRKTGPIYLPSDWRCLLRNYRGAQGSLPPEFSRWVAEQWTHFKGRDDCVVALWRHIVGEVWLKGRPVPGYGTVEDWCLRTGRARPHPLLWRNSELPTGWSAATFYRLLPKRRATRELMQHGHLAAHGAQPDMVLGDRKNLLPLQYVILDDVRADVRCTWFNRGLGEIVYPLFVAGLDAASTIITAHCGKPRARKRPEIEGDGDRAERHGVTQEMALIVVVETLRRWGIPPWGITFVHENAAACVPPEAKALLHSLFGDLIRFEKTAIFHERATAHGWMESGGAPWSKGKAALESFWHLLNVQLANLPGSAGARYDDQPGELAAIEAHTAELLTRARDDAQLAAYFRSPLKSFTEVSTAFARTIKLLEFRTQHAIQGFERVQEWRRSPAENFRPWSEFVALSAVEQDEIAVVKGNVISRLESPAERFCRLLAGTELTTVDDDVLTHVQGPRFPARVRDGKITISRAEHGDDALVFREPQHPLLDEDSEGTVYVAALAADASRVVLASDDGRILGSVARQGRVDLADRDALHREIGRVRGARVADRELLRGYLLVDTEEAVAELRRHNAAALAATPRLEEPPRRTKHEASELTPAEQRKRAAQTSLQAARSRRLQQLRETF